MGEAPCRQDRTTEPRRLCTVRSYGAPEEEEESCTEGGVEGQGCIRRYFGRDFLVSMSSFPSSLYVHFLHLFFRMLSCVLVECGRVLSCHCEMYVVILKACVLGVGGRRIHPKKVN